MNYICNSWSRPLRTVINFGSFSQSLPKERAGSLIRWSVCRSLRSVIRWILVQSGFDRSLIWKKDLLERNVTDQKSWSGSSQRNAPFKLVCFHGVRGFPIPMHGVPSYGFVAALVSNRVWRLRPNLELGAFFFFFRISNFFIIIDKTIH